LGCDLRKQKALEKINPKIDTTLGVSVWKKVKIVDQKRKDNIPRVTETERRINNQKDYLSLDTRAMKMWNNGSKTNPKGGGGVPVAGGGEPVSRKKL